MHLPGNQLKRYGLMFLLCALIMGTMSANAPAATTKKPAQKPATATNADPKSKSAQAAAAAMPATPSKPAALSFLDKVESTYICAESGVTIKEASETGALCASGAKVERYARKMIECGWSEDDILGFVSMVPGGKPVCAPIPGATACGVDGKIQMDFFIMSYCPYGVRLVDNVLPDIINDMNSSIVFTPYFILGKGANGELQSMHGKDEVDEDMRQICIREKYGTDKWLTYFKCFSANVFNKKGQPDAKDWKFCAEQVGINGDDLEKCRQNDAPKMAEKDMQLAAKYGAQGSPTAVYNCSKSVVGAYPYQAFKGPCVCGMIKGNKPAACSK